MKKWLICLTVLFSAFLFTNKVSAATITGKKVGNVEFSIDEEIVYETLRNNDIDVGSYNYIIINNHFSSEQSFIIYLFNDNFTFLTVDKYNSTTKNFRTAPAGIQFLAIKYNFDNTISLLANTISNGTLYQDQNLFLDNIQNGGFILQTNTSAYTSVYSNYNTGITNTYCLIYNNYLTLPEPEPTPNEFKEIINSTQYSKVELIFDISNKETNFNFNYDFHLVDSNGNLDTLNTFKSPYFEETYTSCTVDENGVGSCKPLPVVDNYVIKNANEDDGQCHLDEFGLNNCYKPNDYSNNEELNISNSYVVKNYDMVINNNILTKMTSKLKLIIDLEFNPSVYIDASFTSSLPFEVKYYERTTTTDYYSTVDLTGKYGALFIPKFDNLDDTLNIRTLFKGDGHLDIQHRSSIDLVNYKILSAYSMNYCNEYLYNQDNIPYSCSEYSGEFEFYVSNNNLEQGLFFVNSYFDNDNTATATITYDTRYYVYWVFDTPSSIVPVENPNTGEKEYISLDGFYNYADVDPGFLESLFNKFTDQLYDTFPVIQQFLMVINLFDYNEEYDEAPKLMVSLNSIGIDQEVQIVDFGVFHEHRSTLIFWEMLFITTITIIKVTDNVVKAMKD